MLSRIGILLLALFVFFTTIATSDGVTCYLCPNAPIYSTCSNTGNCTFKCVYTVTDIPRRQDWKCLEARAWPMNINGRWLTPGEVLNLNANTELYHPQYLYDAFSCTTDLCNNKSGFNPHVPMRPTPPQWRLLPRLDNK